jgi:adenylate cyclase class 2
VGINGGPFFIHDGLKQPEGFMNPHARLETEAKLRIPDLESLKPQLLALGFVERTQLQTEQSVLWDRGRELLEQGCALRVRRYAGQAWLTYKGRKQEHPDLKIRPEFETLVDDPAALETILEALGYVPVLHMVKTRALWDGPGLLACLDQTPFGCFLELEGEAEAIHAAMAKFGIGKEAIEPQSYPTLYREAGLA